MPTELAGRTALAQRQMRYLVFPRDRATPNAVGSVPDGWWRERRDAAERLRAALGHGGRARPAGPDRRIGVARTNPEATSIPAGRCSPGCRLQGHRPAYLPCRAR
ncbi:hypothetical protein GCM10010193_07120 [Kitasatospora atroaurantiaca]